MPLFDFQKFFFAPKNINPIASILVPHPGNMTSGFAFRNRPFERNPTTWVPTAPMRNGEC